MGGKLPLIFDCDNTMGVPNHDVDDGLALLYVLGCPEVDLLGVTCSFGNSTQDTVYRNTRRLLQEWGRGDIPVFRGADSPAPLARYLEQILSGWFGWNRVRYGQDGFVNWDLMAAAQLIHPELFALEEGTISHSPQSLRTGGLLGDGPTRRVLLPRIKDRTAYTRHAYRTILSAPVDLTGDISKK